MINRYLNTIFIFFILSFFLLSCGNQKNKSKSLAIYNIDSVKEIISKNEKTNNIHYVNIKSIDNKSYLNGYNFIKNDSLYFIRSDDILIKYPLIYLKQKGIFTYRFNKEILNSNYYYNSQILKKNIFNNDTIYLFKIFYNVCYTGIANCTELQSKSIKALRTIVFIYTTKNGIVFYIYDYKFGINCFPFLSFSV